MRILSATRASLTEQYQALLGTEGVTIDFADGGIEALARIAAEVNEAVENIGARRLQTVMEKLLEDVSFHAEERRGERLVVDAAFVEDSSAGSPKTPTSAATYFKQHRLTSSSEPFRHTPRRTVCVSMLIPAVCPLSTDWRYQCELQTDRLLGERRDALAGRCIGSGHDSRRNPAPATAPAATAPSAAATGQASDSTAATTAAVAFGLRKNQKRPRQPKRRRPT